jgi:hypothetical protein
MTPEVEPIDSEEDHEAALKGGRAVGAPSGTPRADRLGVLATLIDAPGACTMPWMPPPRSTPSSSVWSRRPCPL